jgi:hypothetical protein
MNTNEKITLKMKFSTGNAKNHPMRTIWPKLLSNILGNNRRSKQLYLNITMSINIVEMVIVNFSTHLKYKTTNDSFV